MVLWRKPWKFLTGPSVPNTLIERLWRDVVECVVSVFQSIFLFLEDCLLLDTGDDRQVCSALHFPSKNTKTLGSINNEIQLPFNIIIEHNKTPPHLWASGCLLRYRSPNAGITEVFEQEMPSDLDTYGNHPDGPPPDPDNEVSGVHFCFE